MIEKFLESSYNSSMLNSYIKSNEESVDKKTIALLNSLGDAFESLSQEEIQEIRRNIALKEYLKEEIAYANEKAEKWDLVQERIMNLNKNSNIAGIDYSVDFNKAMNNAGDYRIRANELTEILNAVDLELSKYNNYGISNEKTIAEKTM